VLITRGLGDSYAGVKVVKDISAGTSRKQSISSVLRLKDSITVKAILVVDGSPITLKAKEMVKKDISASVRAKDSLKVQVIRTKIS
jgi:hypothetical protein